MKEPKRLLDQEELPQALRAALRAIEQSAPPRETVARVQRSLAALPASGSGGALSALGWKVGVYGAVGAASLAALVWINAPAREDRSSQTVAAAPSRAAPITQTEAASVDAVTAGRTEVTPPPSVTPAPFSATPLVPAREPSRSREPNAAVRAIEAEPPVRQPGARVQAAAGRARTPLPSSAPVASPAPATVAPSTPAAATQAVERAQPEQVGPAMRRPDVTQSPVPEDEASLLYRAKRAARSDITVAWRMLELHTFHFPDGAYVEEREVLAIDLLRRMGRAREATQRTTRFLERFPRSSYRAALKR